MGRPLRQLALRQSIPVGKYFHTQLTKVSRKISANYKLSYPTKPSLGLGAQFIRKFRVSPSTTTYPLSYCFLLITYLL